MASSMEGSRRRMDAARDMNRESNGATDRRFSLFRQTGADEARRPSVRSVTKTSPIQPIAQLAQNMACGLPSTHPCRGENDTSALVLLLNGLPLHVNVH